MGTKARAIPPTLQTIARKLWFNRPSNKGDNMLGRIAGAVILLAQAAACAGDQPPAGDSGLEAPNASPGDALYTLPPLSTGEQDTVRLVAGEYTRRYDESSATVRRVFLSDFVAGGELDGRAGEDAAVILVDQPGGSGTFYYLAALMRRGEGWESPTAVFLGDRVRIDSLSIESDDGEIAVTFRTRAEGVAMAGEPTVTQTLRYRVVAGSLARVDEGKTRPDG